MDDVHRKVHRAVCTAEPVNAAAYLRREVDGGSVWRRNVGGCEQYAARDVQVGNYGARLGEIPLHQKRLDAGTIDRAIRREDGIDGHDLNCVFKVAADRRAGEKIGRKDQAAAAARVEKLCVGGFACARAAAEKYAELPRAAA